MKQRRILPPCVLALLLPVIAVAATIENSVGGNDLEGQSSKIVSTAGPTSENIDEGTPSNEGTPVDSTSSTIVSTSSANLEPPAQDDLEKSHSDVTESKVEALKEAESSKDENLGTSDTFPVFTASKFPYDAPLVSGAYGGYNQFLPGDVGRLLAAGYGGAGVGAYPNAQPYGQQGFVGNPLLNSAYGYGYANPELFGGAGAGGLSGAGYANPYSGFGGSGAALPYGNYYNPTGLGGGKPFVGSQYPVTLTGGGYQPYANPAYQTLGGYGYGIQKELAAGGGLDYQNPLAYHGAGTGLGYQNPLAYQVGGGGLGYQNPLAYQAAAGGLGYQNPLSYQAAQGKYPDNTYYNKFNPVYSKPGGNKIYRRKDQYGFYTTEGHRIAA